MRAVAARMVGAVVSRAADEREATDGAAVEGEVWSLPFEGVGRLLATIPAPLGLGQVDLGNCLFVESLTRRRRVACK